VIGDFRLQARLGAGGMGRVYLGFSPGGRAVAIKVIHPQFARDPSFAARFQREVAAAQAVNAVYAAPVVAAGPTDTPPWLATAFVPAPSLQDVIATAGPLPEDAVWRLAAGLAEALRAVHASGLVHRDLKPGNVLLAADGPRLIDFGIAQVLDGTRLTTTGGVVGTPSYMSPEQARGESIGPPSDIFSLGGVVCFAAAGQTPFGNGAPASLLYKIVFEEPSLDRLSPQLRSLVAACLAKDPAARPTPAQLTTMLPAVPAGDHLAPSRVAFWPGPVERFINDYRARLDQGGGQLQPPGPPVSQGGWQPVGDPTVGRQMIGETTVRGRAVGGRHARAAAPVAGLNRRRALAALAGAVTAGIGVGGWEAAAHAGTAKPAVPAFSLPKVPPGKPAWRFDANVHLNLATQAGNTVYVTTNANSVLALNATTGKLRWKRTTSSELNGTVSVAGRSVVVSGGSGPYALSAADGKQLWSIKAEDEFNMAVAGGVAYVGFAPRANGLASGVTALDPGNGNVLWTYTFAENDGIAGQLAVAGGVVYVTSDMGKAFALSAVNGGVRRQVSGFGKFGFAPVAALNGVLYAGLDDKKGTVVAVDMTAGTTLWRHSFGASTFPPAVLTASGVIYVGTLNGALAGAQSGNLYALNAKTGKQRWSVPVTGGVNEMNVAGGVIYTGSGNLDKKLDFGTIAAVQAATGKKLWSYSQPNTQGGLSGVSDSRVYANADGVLYSLGA